MTERRNPIICIQEIFEYLEKSGPQSMNNICTELGFSWEQLDSYLALIKLIQTKVQLKDEKLGSRTRIIYLNK
ncbi:MAG: hypothetical protein ACTSO7_17380 [Candidatus Heimdallarchaeota archaeon]